MHQKPLLLLLLTLLTPVLQAQPAGAGGGNPPLIYYYVRVQQWGGAEAYSVDSVSDASIEWLPAWLKPLFNDIKAGKTSVYSTPDGAKPLSAGELNAILFKTDSMEVPDFDTGEPELRVFTSEITHEAVSLIKFCEQWSWDKKGRLVKKVLAFAPVVERDGAVAKTTLFWIKQED